MKTFLILLFAATVANAQVTKKGALGEIESVNLAIPGKVLRCFHNCLPQPGAEFTECWAMVDVGAYIAKGEHICQTHCRYRSTDEYLPLDRSRLGTDWHMANSIAIPENGANCAEYVFKDRDSRVHVTPDFGSWSR